MQQRMHILTALPLLFLPNLSQAVEAKTVILDKKMYWSIHEATFDTLGWDLVEQHLGLEPSGAKCPSSAAEKLRAQGKQVLRLKEPSAIAAAILHELGYPVAVFTQWSSQTSGELHIIGPGSSTQYREGRLASEYLWEMIEGTKIERPTTTRRDFLLTLEFRNGASWILEGKEGIESKARHIPVGAAGASIKFDHGDGSSDLQPVRRVFATYVIADVDTKTSFIIGQIEEEMDKLKLDLSYKVPSLIPVGARKGSKSGKTR